VWHLLGQEHDAALGEFVFLVVAPDQGGPLDQHEDLVLVQVLVVGRRLALADIETAHHQLPVGGSAVEQHGQRPPIEPLELLLLLGLSQVEHAHRAFLSVLNGRRGC
jgi:hypothetical protein